LQYSIFNNNNTTSVQLNKGNQTMTNTINLKHHTTDKGFCRSYYYGYQGGEKNQNLLYCLQENKHAENGKGGEPDYPVSMENKTIERPDVSNVWDKYPLKLYDAFIA
jgi:hypothetical protein